MFFTYSDTEDNADHDGVNLQKRMTMTKAYFDHDNFGVFFPNPKCIYVR